MVIERCHDKPGRAAARQVQQQAVRPCRRKRMEGKSGLTFRISPWRPWLLAVTLLALPAALGVAVSVVEGNLAVAAGILLGLAAVAMVLLLPIGLTAWASRWHVDPHGIGGRNNWLVYHHLDWSEI